MNRGVESNLLATLKARLVLAAYVEPATPSEVARTLELPANMVHYWTRRLVDEELLEVVEEQGRVRTYRAVLAEQPCEIESCAPFVRNIMQALGKVVMAAAEKHDLAERPDPSLLPEVGVHELTLSPSEVASVVEAFKSALPAAKEHASEGGEAYTVSFIVAPGRLSDHF